MNKRSLTSLARLLETAGDPNPGELILSRVSSAEMPKEARTRCRCNDMR